MKAIDGVTYRRFERVRLPRQHSPPLYAGSNYKGWVIYDIPVPSTHLLFAYKAAQEVSVAT